jgi:hypothetical protein
MGRRTAVCWLILAAVAAVEPVRGGERPPSEKSVEDQDRARRLWRESIEAGRRNHQAFMAQNQGPLQPPEDFYLSDSSLQLNDVIVTNKGFLVFIGSADDYPHRESDFKRLTFAEGERLFRVRPARPGRSN